MGADGLIFRMSHCEGRRADRHGQTGVWHETTDSGVSCGFQHNFGFRYGLRTGKTRIVREMQVSRFEIRSGCHSPMIETPLLRKCPIRILKSVLRQKGHHTGVHANGPRPVHCILPSHQSHIPQTPTRNGKHTLKVNSDKLYAAHYCQLCIQQPEL